MTASIRHEHVDDAVSVGTRLREARERAGLSQRQLAFEGCSPAYISRLEAGQRVPSLQLLRKIAARLGVDESYLATGVRAPRSRPQILVDAGVALGVGDVDAAAELFERALDIAGDVRARAEALAGLAQVAHRRGDGARTLELGEQALQLDRSLGTSAGFVEALAAAYAAAGRTEEATTLLESALAAAREREDELDVRRYAVLLANALVSAGAHARAAEVLDAAGAGTEEAADPAQRARALWEQSRRHAQRGDEDAAAVYSRRAGELLELADDALRRAHALRLRAEIDLSRGDAEAALTLARRARDIAGSGASGADLARFRLGEARALGRLGDREAAAREAEAAAALVDGAAAHVAGACLIEAGDVLADVGQRRRAEELYERAAERLEHANPHAFVAYERLSKLFEEDGRTDDALAALKRALGSRSRAADLTH